MSCYWDTAGKVQNFNSTLVPCGSPTNGQTVTCCSAGDTCLSDSICHYTEPSTGGSGYYLGGCTDPSYKDPVCVQACSDLDFQDIVFNFTSALWSCCGGQHSCNDPISDKTFQSPPPAQLQVVATTEADASASASTSAASAPSGIHLSTWDEIGITIAGTVVFFSFIAFMVWRIMRCRQKRTAKKVAPLLDYNAYYGYGQRGFSRTSELSHSPKSMQKAYLAPPREMEA